MESPEQRHRVLAGISRSRILQVLGRSAQPMAIRDLAEALNLHPNTVRQHLDQLVEVGLVTSAAASPTGRGRPAYLYAATPGSDELDPEAYKKLARVLAEQLTRSSDGTLMALAAGEQWGRGLVREAGAPDPEVSAIERLVQLLDRAGFAPDAASAPASPSDCGIVPLGRWAATRARWSAAFTLV